MADWLSLFYGLFLNPVWLVTFVVLAIVIGLLLGSVFLMVALGAVNGKNRKFGSVFVTVLIGVVLGWIPCIGCIIYWYIIKIRHETSWGGAIAAWLIAGLIPLVIVLIVFMLVVLPLFFGII
ncbi:MAG: hypothetical protein WED05_07980 [Candidatus Atabeyarchaeum deiterrae]